MKIPSVLPLLLLLLLLTTRSIVVEANSKKPSTTATTKATSTKISTLSKKLNRQVEDLYVKAERLQDRAFQRVYELQTKAQTLQDKAFAQSQKLERQSQRILDRATQQAKQLQQDAAQNLGDLQTAIEQLPIPTTTRDDSEAEQEEEEQGAAPLSPIMEEEEDASALEADVVVEVQVGDGSWTVEENDEEEVESVLVPTANVQTVDVVNKNKWQNVRERTLPAVIMLGALAAYVRMGGSFVPVVFVVQFGLFVETTSVIDVTDIQKWWWFLTAIVATNGHMLQWPYGDVIAYGMATIGLVSWVIQQNTASDGGAVVFKTHLGTLAATALSLLVLVGQSSFWIATLNDYGLTWILYPAFLVIVNDTMAYVFGMLMGRHPLLPVISPKKTWEGFVGAAISTLAISYPLLRKMMTASSNSSTMSMDEMLQHAIAIATFVSLVSPFGGFLASIVKRAHGKKDFATYIPGHGGAVDRLDCQVFTAPFVYYYLSYALTATKTSAM